MNTPHINFHDDKSLQQYNVFILQNKKKAVFSIYFHCRLRQLLYYAITIDHSNVLFVMSSLVSLT